MGRVSGRGFSHTSPRLRTGVAYSPGGRRLRRWAGERLLRSQWAGELRRGRTWGWIVATRGPKGTAGVISPLLVFGYPRLQGGRQHP